jgi:hypothetical protein
MNHRPLASIASLLVVFAAAPHVLAEEKKAKPSASPRSQVMSKYDVDHNGNLDVTESMNLGSAYKQNPEDPMLKPFDTNADKVLSDQEIMKIIRPNGEPKPKPKPKKKPAPKANNKAKGEKK